jgi:hypothetical protein
MSSTFILVSPLICQSLKRQIKFNLKITHYCSVFHRTPLHMNSLVHQLGVPPPTVSSDILMVWGRLSVSVNRLKILCEPVRTVVRANWKSGLGTRVIWMECGCLKAGTTPFNCLSAHAFLTQWWSRLVNCSLFWIQFADVDPFFQCHHCWKAFRALFFETFVPL